jgi:pSer/pThr/pTyr-binding forkhead associated (FHA) protein
MWKLVIEDDEGKRTVVPLTRDDYTLGRREGNTIRLTERNVSRDHALLRKKMNGGVPAQGSTTFTLHDCSIYNGVYVNGIRVVDGHDLQHGDLIQIGDYRLILQDDSISDQPSGVGLTAEDGKTTLPLGVTRGSLLLERPNRLVMLAGPTPGAEYPLTMERMTLGRAEDASISINHNSVSRLHCEVHALGESRFEIVDKGSSNGVRVNGSDLRRGIIEAGDIIELGDVRFKFVGAGQVFVPGVTESAQLEAISDRAASAALRRGGTSPKAVWFFALSVAALVGAGAFVMLRRSTGTGIEPAPSAELTSDTSESLAIAEAKKLCAAGDCERAHDRLMMAIAVASPVRDSDDFKMIEAAYWDRQLDKAQAEPDLARRRALLETIAKATTVDPNRRKLAADRLQLIEQGAVPAPSGASALPSSATAALTREASAPIAPPTPRPRPEPHTSPRPPTASPSSGGGSVLERARGMILTDPNGAKQLLMPRVMGGKGSREETELLKTICRELRDSACVTACNEKLKSP